LVRAGTGRTTSRHKKKTVENRNRRDTNPIGKCVKVRERVEVSIILTIRDAIREEDDPDKRLQKIISTLKDQFTGDQEIA